MNENIKDLDIVMTGSRGDQAAVIAAYRRLRIVLEGGAIPAPIPVAHAAAPTAPAPIAVQAAPKKEPVKKTRIPMPYTPVTHEGCKTFFITDIDEWKSVIRVLTSIVKGKIVYNIESNVRIFTEDGSVYIEGTNNELHARYNLGGYIGQEDINFCVHAKTLFDMTKKVKCGLSFNINVSNTLKLDIDGNSNEIACIAADDFPLFDVHFDEAQVKVEAAAFTKGLEESIGYVACDTFKSLLKGVHYEEGLMVATDGKRLIKTPVQHEFFVKDWTTTFSPELVMAYLAIESDSMVLLSSRTNGENDIQLTTKGWVIGGAALEGKYPNYKMVIPKDFANEICFDANDMVRAIEQVEPMIKTLRSKKVSLSIEGMHNDPASKVIVEGHNVEMGQMKSNVAAMITGKNVMNDAHRHVAFNYTYIRQVCRDLKDRIVTLSWNNDESPAQLVGDERVFIVMLMKVEEKEEVAA